MAEQSSPKKARDSSTSRLLRNVPTDLLSGIIANSIISTKSFSEASNNYQVPKNGMREKPPLSVPITTLNFKNFVSKSGAIFAVQDAVEAVLGWQNHSKTIAFACLWAWLSLNPLYFILLPNFGIIWVLLSTHSERYPNGMGDDPEVDGSSDKNVSHEPTEGSPDYLSNLTNIQNMMGDIVNGLDYAKENVLVHLDWSNPQHSLNILYAVVFSSILIAFFGAFIPWRLVLLITGETVFMINHPRVQVWLKQINPSASSV